MEALLPGGGFPAASLSSLCGGPASGKTCVALSALREAQAGGGLAAFVDGRGELYPPAALALGVNLARLLIVRPGAGARARLLPGLWAAEVLLASGAFPAVAIDVPLRGVPAARAEPLLRRLRAAAEKGGAAALLLSGPGDPAIPAALRIDLDAVRFRPALRAVADGAGGRPCRLSGARRASSPSSSRRCPCSGSSGTRPPAGALAVVSEGVVRHATPQALAAGVRPGDSLVQARAACAGLEAVPLDGAADRAALRALAEALLSLSPVVEVALPDAVLLDAAGARLAGNEPEASERALAERALGLCRDMGFPGRVAVADGKGVALALARHAGRERTRAAPGEGARALAPLPLEALDLPSEVARWLSAVGVESAGALAALPAETLAHRFGAPGAAAGRLSRGIDPRPLVPFAPETFPHERWDLEDEVGVLESAEPVLFAAKRLADRVAARLAGRGLGASRLRLTLFLDPRGEERVDLPLARPGADAALWLAPCGSGSPGCGCPRR